MRAEGLVSKENHSDQVDIGKAGRERAPEDRPKKNGGHDAAEQGDPERHVGYVRVKTHQYERSISV